MAANKHIFKVEITTPSLEHIAVISEIENTAHSHPWSKNTLLTCFGQYASNGLALYQNKVVGYFFSRIVAGEAELLNICVDPEFQGKGIGEQLLNAVKKRAQANEAMQIWLEVRESNHSAQALYQKLGFNLVDKRKGYYPTELGREDALILACYL